MNLFSSLSLSLSLSPSISISLLLDIQFRFEQPSYTFVEPPAESPFPIFLVTENANQQTEQTFNVTFEAFNCNSSALQLASIGEDVNVSPITQRTIHPLTDNLQRTRYDINLLPDIIPEMAEALCLSACISVLDQSCDQITETTVIIIDPTCELIIL